MKGGDNNNNNNNNIDNDDDDTSKEKKKRNFRNRHHDIDPVAFVCGLIAGVTQAGLLNPYDRALYLSVKNKVPFLSSANFQSPYQGFFQSIGGRALSSGLYFPLEHFFMTFLPTDTSFGPWANFVAGTGAGMVNALVLNPLSAIKYQTWGRDVSRGMLVECLSMWKHGGLRPFGNGLVPTIYRDVVFGGCYTYLRFEYQHYFATDNPEHQWVGNFLAAGVATILSGPFNFVRNVQYATKTNELALTTREVLLKLWRQVCALPTFEDKFHHVQSRLRIGWGTARVAIGMALGHFVYDECMLWYEHHKHDVERVEERLHLIPARRHTVGPRTNTNTNNSGATIGCEGTNEETTEG